MPAVTRIELGLAAAESPPTDFPITGGNSEAIAGGAGIYPMLLPNMLVRRFPNVLSAVSSVGIQPEQRKLKLDRGCELVRIRSNIPKNREDVPGTAVSGYVSSWEPDEDALY